MLIELIHTKGKPNTIIGHKKKELSFEDEFVKAPPPDLSNTCLALFDPNGGCLRARLEVARSGESTDTSKTRGRPRIV